MSNTKIKQALKSAPVHRRQRETRVRLEVQSQRTGNWRVGRARPITVPAAGWIGVGPHSFVAKERDDGYVYFTVHGGLEPTYRLKAEAYLAATKGEKESV